MGKAVSALLHAVFAVVLIRSFPPDRYGYYALAVSFASLFTILADLGLHLLIAREMARGVQDRSKVAGTAAWLKAGLSVLVWMFMVATFPLVRSDGGEVWTVLLGAGAWLLADSAMEAVQAVCHGLERMDWSSVMGMGYRLITVSAGLAALAGGASMDVVIGAVAASAWVAVSGAVWSLRRHLIHFSWSFDAGTARALLLQGWPLAVSGLFTALYFRVDTVILSRVAGERIVGWYGAAYKVYETSMMVPALVASVALPAVAKVPRGEVRDLGWRVMRWMGGGALAAGILGAAAAPWIVRLMGEGYAPSLGWLRVLMAAMPLMWIHHVGGAMVIALMGQQALAAFTAACAGFSLLGYLVWIPLGGADAAAWITLATDAVLAAGTLILLSRRLSKSASAV